MDEPLSDEEIKEFLRRAENAHFRTGTFQYDGWNVYTRDLFAPGTDKVEKAKQIIQQIRQGNRDRRDTKE
jgi:hypothetical protein